MNFATGLFFPNKAFGCFSILVEFPRTFSSLQSSFRTSTFSSLQSSFRTSTFSSLQSSFRTRTFSSLQSSFRTRTFSSLQSSFRTRTFSSLQSSFRTSLCFISPSGVYCRARMPATCGSPAFFPGLMLLIPHTPVWSLKNVWSRYFTL